MKHQHRKKNPTKLFLKLFSSEAKNLNVHQAHVAYHRITFCLLSTFSAIHQCTADVPQTCPIPDHKFCSQRECNLCICRQFNGTSCEFAYRFGFRKLALNGKIIFNNRGGKIDESFMHDGTHAFERETKHLALCFYYCRFYSPTRKVYSNTMGRANVDVNCRDIELVSHFISKELDSAL